MYYKGTSAPSNAHMHITFLIRSHLKFNQLKFVSLLFWANAMYEKFNLKLYNIVYRAVRIS